MAESQNRFVEVYRELSKIPSLDSVSVIPDDLRSGDKNVLHWQAKWSHRDIVRKSKVTYTSTGTVTFCKGQLTSVKSPYTSEITNEKMMTVSPSKLKAVLKEVEIKSEKHHFLEIWNGSLKVSGTDLTKEDKHGLVHANPMFGCLNWSNSSDKIAYVAEKKSPKSKSFFDKAESKGEGDVEVGREFVHREDWGEQLVGAYQPTLFMFDVKEGSVTDLSKYLPDDVSVDRALWSKDDKSLYIIGWNASPWKVGLIYCKNRYSALYKLDLESKELTSLTDGKSCVFSPMLTPDQSKLIYLQSKPMGAHMQCYKLMCLDLTQSESSKSGNVVVDIVDLPDDASCFQGLYVDRITDDCWLSNGCELIVSSLHRSNLALLSIDVSTGKVKLLETEGAWTIMRVEHDVLFASYSTPNTPPVFKAGRYNGEKIEWINIDTPVAQLKDVTWEIVKHEPVLKNENYPGLDYESVLVKPSNAAAIAGMIVMPHGGPHVSFFAKFQIFEAAFCKLGFVVLGTNYRGSLGFGQNSVLSLPKNIGCQDVSDVQHAAQTVAKDLDIPAGRIFVHGGSHGGFLTLHLVGQYPDFYSAAAVRNPVCELVSMRSTTDIMDWCYVESGGEFSYSSIPNEEDIMRLYNRSPIIHVTKVKTPLLFLVGLEDLRCPPSQSLTYVHALQGLGKKVLMLAYNDNHPLSTVDVEADCFMNMVTWFSENLV